MKILFAAAILAVTLASGMFAAEPKPKPPQAAPGQRRNHWAIKRGKV
jgi:hypothetical protein